MAYIDGFLLAVPKRKIKVYLDISRKAGKVWKEHGALEYHECAGDDLNVKWGARFPRLFKAKPSETIVFSWIVYKSRRHRDQVNARVMKDPRMAHLMDAKAMPFDGKRMIYGGFTVSVFLNGDAR